MASASHRAGVLAGLLGALAVAVPSAVGAAGPDGRFESRESSHFVLHQDVGHARRSGLRGADRFERDVLAVLENAYRNLDAQLGLRPPRKLKVFVYAPEAFDAAFSGLFGFAVAGFHADAIRVRGGEVVTVALASTLRHELVHATLDAAAPSLVLPAWLNEGLAEWFEHRSLGQRGLAPSQLAALRDAARAGAWLPIGALAAPGLGHLDLERARIGYLTALALVDHLARRRAPGGLPAFVEVLLRTRDPERALRRVYGLGALELEAELRRELGV